MASLILKALVKFKLLKHKLVLYFESDEESESKDLVYFLDKNKDKVGIPNMIVCLDSGTSDYDHFSSTSTLRGYLGFTLKVTTLNQSIHSGMGPGIVPDSFRIAREII